MSQDDNSNRSSSTGSVIGKFQSMFPIKAAREEEKGCEDVEIFVPSLSQRNHDDKKKDHEDEDEGISLEEDTYTLLLVTKTYGIAFCCAIFICAMQLSLLSSILTQMLSEGAPNTHGAFKVPFATSMEVKFGQFIVIGFALLTQRDLLQTVPLLIALWKKENWSRFNKTADGNRPLRSNERLFWWEKIFLTYVLRLVVSLLTLFTGFVLIIQSTDIIDLVKDFTALFIVAELDEFAYLAIQDGYFGHIFKDEIERAETIKINPKDSVLVMCNKPVPTQSIMILVLFITMFGTWADTIMIKQSNGYFFKKKHEYCRAFDGGTLNYLSWGDGNCDPRLFTEDCGNDGGDCTDICTTFFQFHVSEPYVDIRVETQWTPVVPPVFDQFGRAIEYEKTIVERVVVDPFAEIILKTFNETYEDCPINVFDDIRYCENLKPDCLDSVDSNDWIRNCFDESTVYPSFDESKVNPSDPKENHPWFCWFGVDAITSISQGNGDGTRRKLKAVGDSLRKSIEENGY